jgi:hypothetical protein
MRGKLPAIIEGLFMLSLYRKPQNVVKYKRHKGTYHLSNQVILYKGQVITDKVSYIFRTKRGFLSGSIYRNGTWVKVYQYGLKGWISYFDIH